MPDLTENTGSVHVVDQPARVSADRFVTEEPYSRGGPYQDLTTARSFSPEALSLGTCLIFSAHGSV